jgi:hypothetical protein
VKGGGESMCLRIAFLSLVTRLKRVEAGQGGGGGVQSKFDERESSMSGKIR